MASSLPFPLTSIHAASMLIDQNDSRIAHLKDSIDLRSRGKVRVTETIHSEGRQWQQTSIQNCITIDSIDELKPFHLEIEMLEAQNAEIEKYLESRKDEVDKYLNSKAKAAEEKLAERGLKEFELYKQKIIAPAIKELGRPLSNDEERSLIDFAGSTSHIVLHESRGVKKLVGEWQAREAAKRSPKKAPSALWVACMARVSEMIGHRLSNEEERSFSTFVGRQSGVTHWDTIKLRAKVEEWQGSLA
jgi:hypothetical protein